jgi:hypothetical protein
LLVFTEIRTIMSSWNVFWSAKHAQNSTLPQCVSVRSSRGSGAGGEGCRKHWDCICLKIYQLWCVCVCVVVGENKRRATLKTFRTSTLFFRSFPFHTNTTHHHHNNCSIPNETYRSIRHNSRTQNTIPFSTSCKAPETTFLWRGSFCVLRVYSVDAVPRMGNLPIEVFSMCEGVQFVGRTYYKESFECVCLFV